MSLRCTRALMLRPRLATRRRLCSACTPRLLRCHQVGQEGSSSVEGMLKRALDCLYGLPVLVRDDSLCRYVSCHYAMFPCFLVSSTCTLSVLYCFSNQCACSRTSAAMFTFFIAALVHNGRGVSLLKCATSPIGILLPML